MRQAPFLAALSLCLVSSFASAQVLLELQDDDTPAGDVSCHSVQNGERQVIGSTNAAGVLSFDPALLMGKVKGETIIRECPGYRQLVLIPMDEQWDCRNDEEATGQEDCPCRRIGAWLIDSGRIVIQLQAPPFYTTPVGIGAIAGGAGAVTIIALSGGDDSSPSMSSTTPGISLPDPVTPSQPMVDGNGVWPVIIVVKQDPFNHHPFTRFDQVGHIQTTYNTGGSFQVVGPSPWPNMSGTFNTTTGAFNVRGMGPIAGFNDVVFVFVGSISGNNIEGMVTIGENNTLPQGTIIYGLTGNR